MLSITDLQELPSALLAGIQTILNLGLSSTTQFFSFIVILGGFFLFLLLISPIPGVYHLGYGVTKLLGYRIKGGVSILIALATITSIGLGLGVFDFYKESSGNGFDFCKTMPTDLQVQRCFGSKMRKERNIYMNFLGCVIYFSLNALAPLVEANGKVKID